MNRSSNIFRKQIGSGVEPKTVGLKTPKMDGENKGKTLLTFMIWGETPLFLETPCLFCFFFPVELRLLYCCLIYFERNLL